MRTVSTTLESHHERSFIDGESVSPHDRRGASPPLLEVSGVDVHYGEVAALCGVDLQVGPGEIVGLLGRNGAGKSTLVSVIGGLRRPNAGACRVSGRDPAHQGGIARRALGLAPQDIGIYPTLTVRDNLLYFARISGLRGRREIDSRIDQVSGALSLSHLLKRPARALSGGERRRVHVSAALLHHPRLVVLDEPTAGADVDTRNRLLGVVQELARTGTAVIYSTHYLPEIEQLDSRVVILDAGRVVLEGTVRALVQTYGESFVEMTFDRTPPKVHWGVGAVTDDLKVKVPSLNPASTVAELADAVQHHEAKLLSVEIIRPSLETVFSSVVGSGHGDVSQEGS